MSFEVRPTRDLSEFFDAVASIGQYFGWQPTEESDTFHLNMPLDRMHAAFDDGRIIGGAGVFPFDFSVPGGSLPCGGVTAVGVYPTHRRRGALRAMMRAQLDDMHERGEPIAALWASEETIYGRYGYGIAAWAGEISLKREWASFAQPLEVSAALAPTLRDDVEAAPSNAGHLQFTYSQKNTPVLPGVSWRSGRDSNPRPPA